MTTARTAFADASGTRWWRALHTALMPDYNRKAAVYWWTMVAIGAAIIGRASVEVWALPLAAGIQIAVGMVIAMLAGFFPVRIPRSKNSFAAGEVFIFLLLLLHGPAAATLAAAGEALVGSCRTSKRWTSRLASPAMAATAMFLTGSLLQLTLAKLNALGLTNAGLLIVGSMLFAIAYFVCNTLMVTTAPRLKRNERFQPADLFGVFGWVGIAYAGSAAVAALLYLTFRQSGIGVLMAVLPVIAMLLATLHYFFRQQEADEAVRRAASASADREAEAMRREADAAERHVQALEASERRLHHLAFHDSLTGLPNRRRFHEHLAEAVKRAGAEPAYRFAVMFLDFDRFKLINDSLGHSAGDAFLVQVSQRIQDKLRPNVIVARLGGDEFAILAQDLDHADYAIALAERLIRMLRAPFFVAGTELTSSASIGITSSDVGYTSPDEVLRDADLAMYKAKAGGKARYEMFDVGLHRQVTQRMRLESDLRRVVDGGQLAVAYQPLFNLATGAIVGFEALARWNHAELGTIGPTVFIPIAEETGLILQITDFMLRHACHELARWQRRDPSFAGLHMHVNVSGKDLTSPGFVARVTEAMAAAGVQPRHLILELTENILMERLEAALPMLAELRRLGIGLSVDDFGTGYSSLSHLSSLPIDSLKVDRSFVRDMRSGTKESTVVRAVVHLGNSLGKSVIAEGIETRSQFAQLHEMGCEFGQGFHLSRPLEPDAVDKLLDDRLARSALRPFRDSVFEHSAMFH